MIRVRHTEDIEAVRELDARCFPGEAGVDERGEWWLATADDEPVAYGGVVHLGGGRWYLAKAGVVSGFRGIGLQRRLIRARVAFVRRHGGLEVVTYTAPWNAASARSLIACGFLPYRSPSGWWDDWCLWKKVLV